LVYSFEILQLPRTKNSI